MQGFVDYNHFLRDLTERLNNSTDKKKFLITAYRDLIQIDDDGYALILFNRYLYNGENLYNRDKVYVDLVPTFITHANEKQFQAFIIAGEINLELETDHYISLAVQNGRQKEVAKILYDNGADLNAVLQEYIHKVNIHPEKHKNFNKVILAILDALNDDVFYPVVEPDSVVGKWLTAVHDGV